MGYLTQEHIGNSGVFRAKIQMALIKLIDTTLEGAVDTYKPMARIVMRQLDQYVNDLTKLIALDGLDLDTIDSAIDTAILGHLVWLVEKAGVEIAP